MAGSGRPQAVAKFDGHPSPARCRVPGADLPAAGAADVSHQREAEAVPASQSTTKTVEYARQFGLRKPWAAVGEDQPVTFQRTDDFTPVAVAQRIVEHVAQCQVQQGRIRADDSRFRTADLQDGKRLNSRLPLFATRSPFRPEKVFPRELTTSWPNVTNE